MPKPRPTRRDRNAAPTDEKGMGVDVSESTTSGMAASFCAWAGVCYVPMRHLVADVADPGGAHSHGDDSDVGTCRSVTRACVITRGAVVFSPLVAHAKQQQETNSARLENIGTLLDH